MMPFLCKMFYDQILISIFLRNKWIETYAVLNLVDSEVGPVKLV